MLSAVPAVATSLRARIDQFYAGPFHAPPQGLLLGELVATTVLPPASAPGFGAVDEDSVGPLVTERAATLGARRLVVSARYDDIAWAPEDERDSLGNRIGPFVRLNTEGRLGVDKLTLRQQQYTLSVAYGVRDDVDLQIALPIDDTHVDVRGRGFLEDTVVPKSLHASNAAVGDLLVRGKWWAGQVSGTVLSLMLTASLPTGRLEDISGRDAFTLEPSVVCSRRFGPVRIDLNAGIETNATTLAASRGHYRLATSMAVLKWLGVSAEIDARTGFSEYDRRVHVPPNFDPFRDYDVTFPRMDLADALLALHVRVVGPLRAFVGGRVPIASAGLLPNAVPVFGVSAVF